MSKPEAKQEDKPTFITKLIGELGQKILIGIALAMLSGALFWLKDKYEDVTVAPTRITILENQRKIDSLQFAKIYRDMIHRRTQDSLIITTLKQQVIKQDSAIKEHARFLTEDYKNIKNLRQTLNLPAWD
jgi:hypothetical protein